MLRFSSGNDVLTVSIRRFSPLRSEKHRLNRRWVKKGEAQMSQETQGNDISKKRIVYQIPDVDTISIQREIEYQKTETGEQTLDIYYPPDSKHEVKIPIVIFVNGYPDPGFQKIVGCKLKDMGSYISRGQLTAASRMAAITYTTGTEPATDIHVLIQYIQQNASTFGINEDRIGVWACSANVPNALSILMNEDRDYLKCAVLCYGFMLDLEQSTYVADAAKQWGFANPCAGKPLTYLTQNIPLFIARAGQDETPHLNETIDGFMSAGLRSNLPITFVNHPTAPHAFDLMHDSKTTHKIIRQILTFMQFHLLV